MSKIGLVLALVAIACKGKPAPRPGPPVAWRATIDKDTYGALPIAGGIVTVDKTGVSAWRAGAAVWTRALTEPSGWVVPLGATAVLAGDGAGTVHAIAIADGTVQWTATTPSAEGEHPWIKAAAASGDRVVLLDAYMRFLVLDPAACAAGGAGCMTPSGELASGASAEELAIAPDGTRVVWEYSWVALFTADGERIASFIADDLLGGVSVSAGGIVVTHDQGVARLDPARCKVEGGKFRLGTRDDREEAPPGCVERIHVGPTEAYAPVVAARGGVAWVTADDELRGHAARDWHVGMATLHRASGLVADGDRIYVACWEEPEGDDLFVTIADLCAVSPDRGEVMWRSRLGLHRAGLLDGPWIEVGAGMIYVMLADQLIALPAPA